MAMNAHFASLKDVSSLLEDLPAYREQRQPDIEVGCGKKKVKAHRDVVVSQSSVMGDMLSEIAPIEGGEIGYVLLSEAQSDPALFLPFVRFLYSKELPSDLNVGMAERLYAMAHEYGLERLARACAGFLEANLRPDIACDIFVLADRYKDKGFKRNVRDYIIEKKVLMDDRMWNHFSTHHRTLALELGAHFYKMQDDHDDADT